MIFSRLKERWRLVTLVALLIVLGIWKVAMAASNVGYSPAQPIPFSHKLHAGVNHIPCQYCHAGVDRDTESPIPPLNVCMGCHSVVDANKPVIQKIAAAYKAGKPIQWVRVYDLPQFVKFAHRWHIAAGVACQTCHGPVQDMNQIRQYREFVMGECIACHRSQTYLPAPADKVHRNLATYHGHEVNAKTECSTCHN